MTARSKLLPGQNGTKSLVAKYGDALLCVRYRYDKQSSTRLKTVELIIERTPWKPSAHRFLDTTLVPVRIGYHDKVLQERAKEAHGKWDPKKHAWYIQFGRIKGTELEKLIILETPADKSGL
jgi:menaquinone-dependent protoporphyrinogen IX oxidase